MRVPSLALTCLAAVALAGCGSAATHPPEGANASGATTHDWTRFNHDAARTGHASTGITASRVARLTAHRVTIDGTVDSSPLYVAGAQVGSKRRDLLVMTTTYGKTLALDPRSGRLVWRFTPSAYGKVAGSAQITNATPVLDPGRRYVFAASPDGRIHKLRVSDGHEVKSGAWPASVTRDATHEKIASALNLAGKNVLVTTGGYVGDAPPYQGKVVAISRRSGRITSVFNSLCSTRRRIFQPSSCSSSDSAIWGRAGAVVDPRTHHVFVATSNGPWNGSTDWGDSVLELSAGAGRLLRHYTPTNQKQLENSDADLGSTSPVVLGTRYLLQGGKDGKLRLLDRKKSLHGVKGAAGKRLGGEVQALPLPGGAGQLFTAPATLGTRVFVATNSGTAAYRLSGGRLHQTWSNGTAGTSPVIARGLVYVYDPNGGLNVYRPNNGKLVKHFDTPPGHWNSPIVAGGRVYVPTGDANQHAATGELTILR